VGASQILVVTPTLNRPALCPRAVASLVAQDCADWTLVIAKNGGSDLLAEYEQQLTPYLGDPRVRLLVLPGKGLGYALNSAINQYGNDHVYFAILEDDDEWAPGFISSMKGALDRTGADVANCLQCQVPEARQPAGGPVNPGLMLMQNWINFPMCLFRMSLFQATGGFSEEVGSATDWDWQLRCLGAGAQYTFVNETLVTHHWHGDNYCLQAGAPAYAGIVERMRSGRYANLPRLLAALRAEAAGAHRAGNFRMAEPMYGRVLEINPSDAEVWALAGQLAVQMGNPRLAAERLRQAVSLNASDAGALYQVASLYAALGDRTNARALLERTLSVEPGHIPAQQALRSFPA
jgi:tetratricopeptide (TPR) repeat protein